MAIVNSTNNIIRDVRQHAVVMPPGCTIEECYQEISSDPLLRPMVRAFHLGVIQEDWSTTVAEEEVVVFAIMPAGGEGGDKQVLALVAMVAIMVIAPQLSAVAMEGMTGVSAASAAILGPTAPTVMGMSYATAGSMLTMGISMAAGMALSAMFKPSLAGVNSPIGAKMSDPSQPSAMIIGQSNQARREGVISVVLGKHTIFPDLAAIPYVEKKGCRQTLHALYCCGFGLMEVYTDQATLGGIPFSTLQHQNPGMELHVYQARRGPMSPSSYRGRRHVESLNLVLNSMDPLHEFPVVINSAVAGGSEVYIDIVFPRGIFDISAIGERTKHTANISIDRGSGGSFTPISQSDVLTDFTDVCLGPNGETMAEGAVSVNDTYEHGWGVVTDIIDKGINGGQGEAIDIADPKDSICGNNSWLNSKGAGWNAGIAGALVGPNRCVDNGWNATPYKGIIAVPSPDPDSPPHQISVARFAKLTDPSKNGAIYYTIAKDSYAAISGGARFPEGTYSCYIIVKKPIDRDALGGVGVLVDDMMGSFWVRELDAGGNFKSNITKVDQGFINKDDVTRYTASFEVGSGSIMERLQVGFMFDFQEGRTPSSRRAGIELVTLAIYYSKSVSTPIVATESRIEIRVATKTTAGNGAEIDPPRRGDIIHFASPSDTPCDVASENCMDMGYEFTRLGFYDPTEEQGMPDLITYRYARRLAASAHKVINVSSGRVDSSNPDQWWTYMVLDLDDPINVKGPLIFNRRIVGPGFRITADYQAPIHLGITLKYYPQYRLAFKTPKPIHATEDAVIASISTIRPALPQIIVPDVDQLIYTILEIAVPASETLGQTLKPLAVPVHRKMRTYESKYYDDSIPHKGLGQKEDEADPGENPAWTYLSVLLGPPGGWPLAIGNKDYLKDFVDIDSFRAWATMCDKEDLRCTYISTGYSTVGELLSIIAATGRGRSTFRDNRHSIIFDGDPRYFTFEGDPPVAKPIVRQAITPENSWNASSKMTYINDVHALKVTWSDTATSQQGEVIIYAPGFKKIGTDFYADPPVPGPWKAEKFDTLALPGVGYEAQASRLGEYFMDEVRLRRERCVRTLDVEALISQEGDIVAVQSDAMKLGGNPARVISVAQKGAIIPTDPGYFEGEVVVTLDDPMPDMPKAGVRVRFFDKVSKAPLLTDPLPATITPDHTVIQFTMPSGARIKVGYMILWGRLTRISQDYQIASIKYSADKTATLEMLEYYPDPLNYDGDRVVVGESPTAGEVEIPDNLQAEVKWLMSNGWVGRYYLSWDAVRGIVGESGFYRVNYRNLRGENIDALTSKTHYIGKPFNVGCDKINGNTLFRVFAIDNWGNESDSAEVRLSVETPDIFIGDIEGFEVDVSGGSTILSWKPIKPDLYSTIYEIRYASNTDSSASSWEVGSNWIHTGNSNTFDSGDKRSGIYYIKAFGPCGTESETASMIIVDLVSTTDKSPKVYEQINFRYVATPGSFRNCHVDAITCKKICDVYLGSKKVGVATGLAFNTINFIALLDTNEPGYPHGTCKHKPEEHGYCFLEEGWLHFLPDMMANHIPPNSECYIEIEGGGGAYHRGGAPEKCPRQKEGFANVYHYYRTWSGNGVPSGQFRLATGGLVHVLDHIQFASKIVSEDSDVSPMITQTIVRVSYKSRTESDNNVKFKTSGPFIGLRITYETPFQLKPAISILGQELRPGDYWEITQDKPEGFTIKFYNSTGATRDASFDWIANGYGAKR